MKSIVHSSGLAVEEPRRIRVTRAAVKRVLVVAALIGSFFLGEYVGDKRCAVPHGAKVLTYNPQTGKLEP